MKHRRHCSHCGRVGHDVRTCPGGKSKVHHAKRKVHHKKRK